MCKHRVCDLNKAGNVCACNKVALAAVILSSLGSSGIDVDHDVMQSLVNILEGPRETDGVLAHLETGGSNAACVCSLSGSKKKTCLLECVDSLGGRRHIRTLCNRLAAVCDK